MPAAVNDLQPRNGPTRRYFIPLKTFSSGLVDSAVSASLAVAVAAGWVVCAAGCEDLTAFDCRSGLVCAGTAVVNQVKNEMARIRRTQNKAFFEPMFEVISGEYGNDLSMVILEGRAAKGCSRSRCNH